MQSESEIINNHMHICKLHPGMKKIVICRSPFCGYYRQLCQKCVSLDQQHEQKYHINIQKGLAYVQNKIREIQKSMLVLKRQKQQKLKSNPITLPFQIKQKLQNIRLIINEKISLFQRNLQQQYQKQVNLKLQNLQQTIKKSLDFLKKEINELQNLKYLDFQLKKFFINFDYWQHERKYFKSYIQEILEKQVKNFKQGFDQDNIMKLIVSFQINLQSIFSPEKLNQIKEGVRRNHLFYQDKKQTKKFQVVQRYNYRSIQSQTINRPYPKQNYKWQGVPQSIYSQQLDCFYIFGQGDKPSNSIIRFQDGRYNDNQKFTIIGQMLTKRAYFSVCVVKGQIYIIGGYNQKQGCLTKCQKMVVNQRIKLYLVSSLQQRSACHSVCNYKNKYILKFGGTSVKLNENQRFYGQQQIKQLYPQIYDIQKQQWKIIRYNIYQNAQRLQIGLWPLIVPYNQNDQNKIIVYGNKPIQKKYDKINYKKNDNIRKRFEIKFILSRNQIQMKIKQNSYKCNKKYFILPQTLQLIENQNVVEVIAKDINKSQNPFYLVKLEN